MDAQAPNVSPAKPKRFSMRGYCNLVGLPHAWERLTPRLLRCILCYARTKSAEFRLLTPPSL